MNALNRHLEKTAETGFILFVRTLIAASKHFEYELEITDNNSDEVSFSLNGYPYTLTWGEGVAQKFRTTIPVVEYQLSAWHTTPGGRWYPPEDVDVTLLTTRCVQDCVSKAITSMLECNLNAFLEGHSMNEQMLEDNDLINQM